MITGHYIQNQSLTELDLPLLARQNGTSRFCNHQRSILDHCLEWTSGLYVFNCLKVQNSFPHTLDYLLTNPHCQFFQVNIFTEEIIRAGSAAALSVLLNRLDPVLRQTAHLGRLACYSCHAYATSSCWITRKLGMLVLMRVITHLNTKHRIRNTCQLQTVTLKCNCCWPQTAGRLLAQLKLLDMLFPWMSCSLCRIKLTISQQS